jgi:hypothetical protein
LSCRGCASFGIYHGPAIFLILFVAGRQPDPSCLCHNARSARHPTGRRLTNSKVPRSGQSVTAAERVGGPGSSNRGREQGLCPPLLTARLPVRSGAPANAQDVGSVRETLDAPSLYVPWCSEVRKWILIGLCVDRLRQTRTQVEPPGYLHAWSIPPGYPMVNTPGISACC